MIAKRYCRWLAILLTGLTFFARHAAAQDTQETDESIERRSRVSDLLQFLEARPGRLIAEVGAGDGFYTVRIARAVAPGGRAVAEDIDEAALKKLSGRAAREKTDNVDVILGATDDPHLGIARFDALLIHNAYHEMVQHEAMLRHVYAALKPGGRFVLVEPMHDSNLGLSRAKQVAEHNLDISIAGRELRKAGFKIVKRDPNFVTFTKVPGRFWLILARRP